MSDFLDNGQWFVWRDHSLAVWDEYIPQNTWSGYRKLNDVLLYRIDIRGKRKADSFGLKPWRWSAKLDYNGHQIHVPSTHPSCKSIKDACGQADKALTEEAFKDACKKFLSRQLATCIVKEDKRPYFTTFGRPKWMSGPVYHQKINYPYGKYFYAYRFGDDIHWSEIKLSSVGYGSSSTNERFEHWL